MSKKICIFGLGYVGYSIAAMLAKDNIVLGIDLDQERVDLVNNGLSTIDDNDIKEFLKNNSLNISASKYPESLPDVDFVVIATPTNYDEKTDSFETSSVSNVIEEVKNINKNIPIIIKSTIPIGFTDEQNEKFNTDNIFFAPEFLREGTALYDNLNPSRIIISSDKNEAKDFVMLMKKSASKKDIPTLFTSPKEAESIKLFANTFLAMRVAFFNELDNFSLSNNLNTKEIIEGISFDTRIGNYYNNPSFGYGGYCLPKDTKQLLANYKGIPQELISAIVKSNDLRMDYLSSLIIQKKPTCVGIYRLVMKKDSENFRSSAVQGIIQRLMSKGIQIIIYEPNIDNEKFNDCTVVNDLDSFKESTDIIIANRMSKNLQDIPEKIFTRDLFGDN
jgi:UDPglucose 6-dehydrogenase